MLPPPSPAAFDPAVDASAEDGFLASGGADAPADGDGRPAPRRRWQMRTSDKIGMGTFSVASVSAYLLWSVVQGMDDLRQDVRGVADEQRNYAVTQERIQNTQREHYERFLAHETQAAVHISDLDGRLSSLRRTQEDQTRETRDHDQRLRVIETDRAGPRRATAE